jgi:mono/diheme cytochrome c family protein
MARPNAAENSVGRSGLEIEMRASLVALTVVVALTIGVLPSAVEAQRAEPGPQDWWGPRSPEWERMWPRDMERDRWSAGRMGVTQNQRMLRHWTFMTEGVPEAYRGAVSTVEPTPAALAQGSELYAAQCADCHGAIGYGDGTEGLGLVPSPALLSYLVERPMAGDEYLLWAIADGGAAFGTEMPAFKHALTDEETWSIIEFMRAGFSTTTE